MKKKTDLPIWDIESLILKELATHVRPGITTMTLNNIAASLFQKHDVASFDRHYAPDWAPYPYPYETCISVNDEIAHGFPSDRVLKEGDLVNIDVAIIKNGQCADAAFTLPVGKVSEEDALLIHTAKKALYAGIATIHDGVKVGTIARAIDDVASYRKLVVNVNFTGHGIGSEMHMEPVIYQARNPFYNDHERAVEYQKYLDIELKAGQIVCIEPILTKRDQLGEQQENKWTFKTRDHSKCAMMEHMILVKQDGYEILTTHIEPPKKGE